MNLTSIIISFVLRYGIAALLSISIWNTATTYWPISLLDPDKREISSLNSKLNSCTTEREKLALEKNDLEAKIIEQNAGINKLKEKSTAKERRLKRETDRLSKDLQIIKDKFAQDQTEIETCQDAIDYLIEEK